MTNKTMQLQLLQMQVRLPITVLVQYRVFHRLAPIQVPV
jgi:hypothetical protein